MPIYEYGCQGCGHTFEQLQKVSDGPPSACPSCEGPEIKKLVSRTSFVLKGGGWYKDHYGLKRGGGDSSSTSESTSGPTSEGASGGSSSTSESASSGSETSTTTSTASSDD